MVAKRLEHYLRIDFKNPKIMVNYELTNVNPIMVCPVGVDNICVNKLKQQQFFILKNKEYICIYKYELY